MPLVRPARADDFDNIAALTNHFINTTPIHFSYQPVTPDELRHLWQSKLHLYPWLVAEADNAFAGYAKAGPWRERSAYQWTPEAGIYVEPRFHRQGVGRALYLKLFDVLRAQGYHSLIGGLTLPNPASQRLHESLGFRPAGIVRRAGWKMNQWWDVAFYQYDLAHPDSPAPSHIKPPPNA